MQLLHDKMPRCNLVTARSFKLVSPKGVPYLHESKQTPCSPKEAGRLHPLKKRSPL